MDATESKSLLAFDGQTQEAIHSQLNRILSSPFFRESPAANHFLRFVVQAVLSGQSHQIKQYTIAVDALGYPKDFDPNTSTSIRVLAGRVRVMRELYYLHEGAHDDIRTDL